jgi:hypothetical protein
VAEVATYVSFRMRAAGYRGPEVFTPQALARIARASGGLTRRINILSDKALLAAFGEGVHAVTPKQVRAAIEDSEFTPPGPRPRHLAALAAAGAAGMLIGLAAYWFLEQDATVPAPAAAVSPASRAEAPVATPAAAPAAAPAAPTAPPEAPAPAQTTPAPAAAVPSPPEQLDHEQGQRFAGYSAEGQPLLSARLAATRRKLAAAPSERVTLELYITENTSPARLERFLRRASDLVPLDSVFLVPVPGAGQYRIWAIYGDYPDEQSAVQAGARLPPKYQREFPLAPRTFAEIRRVL